VNKDANNTTTKPLNQNRMKTNILSMQIKWWISKTTNETKGGSFNGDLFIKVLQAKLKKDE